MLPVIKQSTVTNENNSIKSNTAINKHTAFGFLCLKAVGIVKISMCVSDKLK